MTSVLVLGGARSGKSQYAERLVAGHQRVRYVATGPTPDASDLEWSARVAAHQARRPGHWRTIPTAAVAECLTEPVEASEAFLVDCLGTWLTRVFDEVDAWPRPERLSATLPQRVTDLTEAIRVCPADVVLVSNEVGLGIVPGQASTRRFRDELGRLNTAVADVCDRVVLVLAGRALDLTDANRVTDVSPLVGPFQATQHPRRHTTAGDSDTAPRTDRKPR